MKLFFRIFFVVLIFSIFSQSNLYGYEDEHVHPELNRLAVMESNVDDKVDNFIKNSLGFTKGIKTMFYKKSVIEWIEQGGTSEDNFPRYFNHFHDPLKSWQWAGLGLVEVSSLLWAQQPQSIITGEYSWEDARRYYYDALTTGAEKAYGKTFRALGQIMHLVADASVPAHVRNDPHPFKHSFETWTQKYVRSLSGFSDNKNVFVDQSIFNRAVYDVYAPVPISALWDQDIYDGSNPEDTLSISVETAIGVAEYTNANFLSDDTIYDYPHPINDSDILNIDWKNPEVADAEDGIQDFRIYIWRRHEGQSLYRIGSVGYMSYDCIQEGYIKFTPIVLDDIVCEDYAGELIPYAVSYPSELLDYFFRGTLEITAPDRYVYSIMDGSEIPHEFTYIKAKVRNSTTGDDPIEDGIIQAVARYKKRTDYQPNLSTDPPTEASREDAFSYSVSAEKEIESLSSTDPTEFLFDFTSSPIPAGVTDLYLYVIFKGTLGGEEDIAIAVGMKDLNEPMHICLWNATDRFYLDGVLRTGQEIRNDTDLLGRVDFDGDEKVNEVEIGEPYIDPYDLTTEVTFYQTSASGEYHASYNPLAPASHGRIIILTDTPTFYMRIYRESTDPLLEEDSTSDVLFSGVVYQEDSNGDFHNTQVRTFRGIIQHAWSAYSRYYPDSTGITTAPWPVPTNIEPVPAISINP